MEYCRYYSTFRYTKSIAAVYGKPEISSTQFTCRLCSRSMKRTRNIVTVHMKTVHGVSWQAYMAKTRPGAPDSDMEDHVELFKCALCEKQVKGKKQHLTRIHKIDMQVYDSYVNKLELGEKVPELHNCKICNRVCLELEKHVKICHRIEMDEYYIQEIYNDQESSFDAKDVDSLPCSFKCGESFEKENDLIIHINIVHANEDEEAKQRAKSKILSEQRAKQISERLACKVCGGSYCSRSSLWVHVTRKHQLTWKDYEAKFGSVEEVISKLKPFQCNICGEEVGNEKQKVIRHLLTHNMTHSEYLEQYVKNNNAVEQQEESSSEEDDEAREIKQEAEESCDNKLSSPPPAPRPPLSSINVTDKSVKSCARCQLEFPSRLRFLRHCQLVHKMKFKLRTGEKLLLP